MGLGTATTNKRPRWLHRGKTRHESQGSEAKDPESQVERNKIIDQYSIEYFKTFFDAKFAELFKEISDCSKKTYEHSIRRETRVGFWFGERKGSTNVPLERFRSPDQSYEAEVIKRVFEECRKAVIQKNLYNYKELGYEGLNIKLEIEPRYNQQWSRGNTWDILAGHNVTITMSVWRSVYMEE